MQQYTICRHIVLDKRTQAFLQFFRFHFGFLRSRAVCIECEPGLRVTTKFGGNACIA